MPKRRIILALLVLFAIALLIIVNGSQDEARTTIAAKECADSIDNDGDYLKDQTDPACWSDPRDSSTYDKSHPEEKVASPRLSFELPEFVIRGEQATLRWQAANVLSGTCAVSGKNGDAWDGDSGEQMSSPLTASTIFTFRCNNLKNDLVAEQKVVNITP